jgi:colanic acid/amylovoran biosynthesis protein
MNILVVRVHSLVNAGDQAILGSTLRLLAQAFPNARQTVALQDSSGAERRSPGAEYVGGILSWDAKVDTQRQWYVNRVGWLWHMLLILLSVACYRFCGRRRNFLRDPEQRSLLEAYFDADLVCATGGGYLYETRWLSPWFVGIVGELALAIWLGKPLILLPQSIGPLPAYTQRWLVRWLLGNAALVLVREAHSYALLKKLGVRGAVLQFPDLAFAQRVGLRQQARDWLEQQGYHPAVDRPLVALTVINWTAQSKTFTPQQQATYEQALVTVVDTLIAKGTQVIFLPQCCGPTHAEDDRLVALRIRSHIQQPAECIVAIEQPDAMILQAVCRECILCIGTRMHSVIFALNGHVPTCAIGYLAKSHGILEWLEWEQWCVDITQVDGQQLYSKIEQLLSIQQEAALLQLWQRVDSMRRVTESLPALLQSLRLKQ